MTTAEQLEALRLQRKGAVDFENDADQKRLEELEKEANEILARRQKRTAEWLLENAKYEGKLELLREQLEVQNGNHSTE